MYLVIALLFKFCDVIHLVIGQSGVDMFFIDWEKPDLRPETTHNVSLYAIYRFLSVFVLFVAASKVHTNKPQLLFWFHFVQFLYL